MSEQINNEEVQEATNVPVVYQEPSKFKKFIKKNKWYLMAAGGAIAVGLTVLLKGGKESDYIDADFEEIQDDLTKED